MAEATSDSVRAFVRAHVRSMLQLETLLLLARDPARWWSASEVGRELRSDPEASAAQLERLGAQGLLAQKPGEPHMFQYAPREQAHRVVVTALEQMHRERFHALVDLIYARDRAQVFADAFKLKKSEDDDG